MTFQMTAHRWRCLIPNQVDWLFFNPSSLNICPTSGHVSLSAESSDVLKLLSPSNFLTENPVWSQTAAAFMFYFINNLRARIRCWSVPSTLNKVSFRLRWESNCLWKLSRNNIAVSFTSQGLWYLNLFEQI